MENVNRMPDPVNPTNAAADCVAPSVDSDLDRQAFDRTAAVREGMDVSLTPHYQLDAFFAWGKTMWSLPLVMPHRADLLTLPKYDIGHLDNFEDYGRGLRYAQTEVVRRIQRSRKLPEVAAEGWELRTQLSDRSAEVGGVDAGGRVMLPHDATQREQTPGAGRGTPSA